MKANTIVPGTQYVVRLYCRATPGFRRSKPFAASALAINMREGNKLVLVQVMEDHWVCDHKDHKAGSEIMFCANKQVGSIPVHYEVKPTDFVCPQAEWDAHPGISDRLSAWHNGKPSAEARKKYETMAMI